MDTQLLARLGKIAGVAGIALGLYTLIVLSVVKYLAATSPGELFALIRSILTLTFGIAGIGVLGWLVSLNAGLSSSVPSIALYLVAGLIVLVLAAALYIGTPDKPVAPTIAESTKPDLIGSTPPALTRPSNPANGFWDVSMQCPEGSAVREMGALFAQGLYSRGFSDGSTSGASHLAMGYQSPDSIRLTGYIAFDKAGVYIVDGTAKQTSSATYDGSGRFGSSTNCKFSAVKRD